MDKHLRRTSSVGNLKRRTRTILVKSNTNNAKKSTKVKSTNGIKVSKLKRVNMDEHLKEVAPGNYNTLGVGNVIYWKALGSGKLAAAMIRDVQQTDKGRRYFKLIHVGGNRHGFNLYWDRVNKIYVKETPIVHELQKELKMLKIKVDALVKILTKSVGTRVGSEYKRQSASMAKQLRAVNADADAQIKRQYITKFKKDKTKNTTKK